MKKLFLFIFFLTFLCFDCYCEDIDVLMGGFETEEDFSMDEDELKAEKKNFQLYCKTEILGGILLNDNDTGVFKEKQHKLSSLKVSLDINTKFSFSGWNFFSDYDVNHDFFPLLNGSSGYEDLYINDVEKNFELKELWAEKSITPNLDFKFGRQIVSWGVSDTLRLVDVVNPVDNRSFGMTDIEDTRQAVAMTKLDLYKGPLDLSLIAVHEIKGNRISEYGSPYYAGKIKAGDDVDESLMNTEFALSFKGHFRKVDAGLYFASFFDDTGKYDFQDKENKAPYVKMLGMTSLIPVGNLMLKSEAALFSGKEYSGGEKGGKERLDLLLGLEYSGFTDTDITAEILNRHIYSFEGGMKDYGECEDEFSLALRFERKFFNETLNLNFVTMLSGFQLENGGFLRVNTEYKINDYLKVESGCVFYNGGENQFFETLRDNDLIFFKIVYDFDIY